MNTFKSTSSFSLRSRAAGALAILALTIAAAATPAHAQTDRVAVYVPFEFVVGQTAMPAGDYMVTRRGSNLVELRATNQDAVAVATTAPLDVDRAGERRSLTFNRYGEKYFLASITSGDGRMQLRPSRSSEQERLAKSGVQRETVAVVAK